MHEYNIILLLRPTIRSLSLLFWSSSYPMGTAATRQTKLADNNSSSNAKRCCTHDDRDMLYIIILWVCVCVCVCTATSAENELFLFNVSFVFFFFLLRDLLCPLSFHRLVKFSMSDKDMYYYYYYYYYVYRSYRPARIRTLFFISIIDSPLQHDGSAPVILFFFFFSNGRMMSIIMHFFSLRAQITLLYDPPSSFV